MTTVTVKDPIQARVVAIAMIVGGLVFAGLAMGIRSYPYCAFDTPSVRQRRKVWNYFFFGFLGFVLFGTLLPALRKLILGW